VEDLDKYRDFSYIRLVKKIKVEYVDQDKD
jgi:hypothetical protein